jgi:hypothetical protein
VGRFVVGAREFPNCIQRGEAGHGHELDFLADAAAKDRGSKVVCTAFGAGTGSRGLEAGRDNAPAASGHFVPGFHRRRWCAEVLLAPVSPYDVLVDPTLHLFEERIFDVARSGYYGSSKWPGEGRIHVRAMAPILIRGDQPQSDRILEDMGRRIDQRVQCAPQGDAYCSAIRSRSFIAQDASSR